MSIWTKFLRLLIGKRPVVANITCRGIEIQDCAGHGIIITGNRFVP
jgi:hypothetical protein